MSLRRFKNETNKSGEKDTRFDFLKVFMTLLIVGWHITQHTNFCEGGEWSLVRQPASSGMITMTIFGLAGQVAVTVFIIISSWFMSERKIAKSGKVLSLVFKTAILSVAIYIVLLACGLVPFSLANLVKEFITPLYTQYWFLTCYCIYYFTVPIINKIFFEGASGALRTAVIILTFLIPIWNTLLNGLLGDFSWFIYIHVCVLYFKVNSLSDRIGSGKFIKTDGKTLVIIIFLWYAALFIDLLFIRNYSIYVSDFIFGFLVYRSVPVVVVSFSIFFYIQNCNHKFSRIWTYLTQFTLPVYIVHENFIWYADENPLLWNSIFQIDDIYNCSYFPVYILGVIFLIFSAGVLSSLCVDKILLLFKGAFGRCSAFFDKYLIQFYQSLFLQK